MAPEFTVRQCQSSDAEQIISLWQDVLPSTQTWNEPRNVICRKRNRLDQLFFVGELAGNIIATVLAGYDGVRGWIYALAVARDQQGHGFGRRMLEKAENSLHALACPKVNLQVRADNDAVVKFYERCGYTLEDRCSLGKPLRTDQRTINDPVPTIAVDDRISLSQIEWSDKAALIEHLNATPTFRENTAAIPFPYEEIDADQWMTKLILGNLETDSSRTWAIRNTSGRLVGGIGLMGMTRGERSELGYWLAESHWGQDIMTSAVRTLCDFAFAEYELRRIFAAVFGTNPASARVLEKAGFEQEGTLRGHFFHDGKAIDVLYFGRLAR